jgi:K+-sensing histidine kinase KdpD
VLQEASNLTSDQQKGVAIIRRSGEHLLTLLNDILDVSAFENGDLELQSHEFALAEFLQTIIEITDMQIGNTRLTFRCERQPNLPVRIESDEQRLRQVLLKLLNNAIKFTEHGSVTLRIANCELRIADIEEHQSEIRRIRFEIEDTGIGIPPEKLREILLPFQQIEGNYHSVDGAGLGLTICHHLLELMGSTLHVESIPGAGSRFWFDLAVSTASYAQGAESSLEKASAGWQQATADLETSRSTLPPEYVARLLQLAERGNPRKLLAALDTSSHPEARQNAFIEQLRHYAENYQIEQCLELLQAQNTNKAS